MTTIPKHERAPRKGAKKPAQPTVVEHAAPAITLDVDMSGVEAVLEKLGLFVEAYVANASTGENSLALFTGSGEAYSPLRLVLEGDAMDSVADSLKRIADAMTAHRQRRRHSGDERRH